MSRTGFPSLVTIPLLLVAVALTGCQSTEEGGRHGTYSSTSTRDASPQDKGMTASTRPTRSEMGAGEQMGPSMAGGRSRVSLAYPTGLRETSAVMLEKMVPPEVRVGQTYEYEMRVTNLTPMSLQEVQVTDDITEGFRVESSAPKARSLGDGKLAWSLGTLGPRETKVIRLRGQAQGTGTITACAAVTYASEACVTTRVVEPKLRVRKSAPEELLVCDPITLDFVVSNAGSGTARNVVVEDDLPSGWSTANGGRKIRLNAGNLEAGQSKRMQVTVKAGKTGRFTNTATAKADGGLEATSNTTTTVVRQPVLTIEKSCPSKGFVGTMMRYEITVTNTGDGVARDAVIEDTLPNGITFVNASDGGRYTSGKIVWNLGTLQPRDSRKVTVQVRAGNIGSKTNRAEARAYCAKAVMDQCVTEVTGIPAVLLEVVDVEDPVQVGNNVTYVITVTNQGSAPGTNIQISCQLESTMEFAGGTGDTGLQAGAAGSNRVVFSPLSSLAPKAKAIWRVRVKAKETGDVRFKTTMKTDQLGRVVEETEATNFYQ